MSSINMLELNAKDVLEQELKIKREDISNVTALEMMANVAELQKPEITTSLKRPRSPDTAVSSSTEPAGRRHRTQFTETQIELLETTFVAQNYPSSSLRQQIHEMTGIPKDNIKIWFQNRRAREKRRKERCRRRGVANTEDMSKSTTTTKPASPSHYTETMTTLNWNDNSATTPTALLPRCNLYQMSGPGMRNRRNWYWANAYHPYTESVSLNASNSFTLPNPESVRPVTYNTAPYAYHLPHIPETIPTFAKLSEQVSLSRKSPTATAESFVNTSTTL